MGDDLNSLQPLLTEDIRESSVSLVKSHAQNNMPLTSNTGIHNPIDVEAGFAQGKTE